jgi:hypothetical protein
LLINGRLPLPSGLPDWSPAGEPGYVAPKVKHVTITEAEALAQGVKLAATNESFFKPKRRAAG